MIVFMGNLNAKMGGHNSGIGKSLGSSRLTTLFAVREAVVGNT